MIFERQTSSGYLCSYFGHCFLDNQLLVKKALIEYLIVSRARFRFRIHWAAFRSHCCYFHDRSIVTKFLRVRYTQCRVFRHIRNNRTRSCRDSRSNGTAVSKLDGISFLEAESTIISWVAIVAIIGADIILRSYSWHDFLAFSAGDAPCNWVTRTTVYIVTSTPPWQSFDIILFYHRVNNVLYFDRSSN